MNIQETIGALHNMYLPTNRYNTYGDVLLKMNINGIRGLSTVINFDFPITVITGKNGSGKSTIAQLALCCYQYKRPGETHRNPEDYYTLGNFFIRSNLDPHPYADDAYLSYTYATSSEADNFGQLSLDGFNSEGDCPARTRIIKKGSTKWRGYSERPNRKCIYFGMGFFVPHHEMGSRIYLDPTTKIRNKRGFSSEAKKTAAQILGTTYQSLEVATIENQSKRAQMGFASRFNATYSENHMGCGEGRLIRMVDALESAPERSLVVIEEPETALHQDAQHQLACYFLDVCKRKRHQLIITTHSPSIIEVMPMEARKKIERTDTATTVENNPTIAEIVAHLSDGHHKTLLIYVEDRFSEQLLIEIIRKYADEFSQAISIAAVGNKDDVAKAVDYTNHHLRLHAIGIRDEEKTAEPTKRIFAYPSNQAPESEVFMDSGVTRFFLERYKINLSEFLGAIDDHHNYPDRIARRCNLKEDAVILQGIQAYLDNQNPERFYPLLNSIKSQCP